MSDEKPHERHADDARPDDAAPTPVVSDEVSEAAASAQSTAEKEGDSSDDA
ncbi:hypothetical protein [Microbacterium sp. NPDC096154]|uniref:hypothetical protein n=1 Tax=Microbacterium sp. NPDC096154 TaxID=3155549 RepID=UPI0033267483